MGLAALELWDLLLHQCLRVMGSIASTGLTDKGHQRDVACLGSSDAAKEGGGDRCVGNIDARSG